MTKCRFLVEVEFQRELEPDEMQQMRVALRNFAAGDEIAELPGRPGDRRRGERTRAAIESSRHSRRMFSTIVS